jgi:hypothetical protein
VDVGDTTVGDLEHVDPERLECPEGPVGRYTATAGHPLAATWIKEPRPPSPSMRRRRNFLHAIKKRLISA